MITREQLADLQPGDVVELVDERWPEVIQRGPLHRSDEQTLSLGVQIVRHRDEPWAPEHKTLTVVSRAPRLYVNHPRTEPVPGDVVRDADSEHALALFIFAPEEEGDPWWLDTAADWISPAEMREKRLRLLVDGETGQVVQ